MSLTYKIYLFAIIICTMLSKISAEIFDIHWINIFGALMASLCFYQILDWRFGEEEDNN